MRKIFLLSILFIALPAISQAQSVDLLWQGNTYTPPFYKGRALWSNQSGITLVAIPNGLGNPSALNYKWTRNGTVLGSVSGQGKNVLRYTDSILGRPQTFKVEIISVDKGVMAQASVSLAPTRPSLAVYENHPLYGFLFNKEVSGTHSLGGYEVTFAAFPLFFSSKHRHDGTTGYQWSTNAGGEAQNSNAVTYRTPEETSGTARVTIKAMNPTLVMQEASKTFSIQFGNQ